MKTERVIEREQLDAAVISEIRKRLGLDDLVDYWRRKLEGIVRTR